MPHQRASHYFNHYPRIEEWIKENSRAYGQAADKMKAAQHGSLLPQQEVALVAVYGEEAQKAYQAVEKGRLQREVRQERMPEVIPQGERRLTKRYLHPNHHYYSRDAATGRFVGRWHNPRRRKTA